VDSTTRHDAPSPAHRRGTDPHAIHGLVAIANGPDYCLCGNHWPCRPPAETAH
jgi:hypothetical protein